MSHENEVGGEMINGQQVFSEDGLLLLHELDKINEDQIDLLQL